VNSSNNLNILKLPKDFFIKPHHPPSLMLT